MKIKRSLAAFLVVLFAALLMPTSAFGAPFGMFSEDFPFERGFYIAAALAALALIAWVVTLFVAFRARRSICRNTSCSFNPDSTRTAEPYGFGGMYAIEEALVPEVSSAADPQTATSAAPSPHVPAPSLSPSAAPLSPASSLMDTEARRALREDAVQHAVQALSLESLARAQVETENASTPPVDSSQPVEPSRMDFTDDMIQQVLYALRASQQAAVAASIAPATTSDGTLATVIPASSASSATSATTTLATDGTPTESARILTFMPAQPRRRGAHFRNEADALANVDDSETSGEILDLIQQLMRHAQTDIERRQSQKRAS
ncbi:MAG: hypothetical protein LBO07_06850 [Coriobacteriales bacterium]|jgi:hypothetical protein|nr:hypothetical protein [Coriobacteriales bacterium]